MADTGSFEKTIETIMSLYQAPGLVIRVINRDGEDLYTGMFGYRDLENKLTVDAQTIFGIASITKSFTSIAAMQLQEKGLLSLDDSLAKYFPSLKDDSIRLKHLMNHSAGFGPMAGIRMDHVAERLGNFDPETEYANNTAIADEGCRMWISKMNEVPSSERLGKVGKVMSYFNPGYGLLGEIERTVSGEISYAEYLRKNILDPLGMDRSTIEFVKPSKDDNCATLYRVLDGRNTSRRGFYCHASVLPGSGGLHSTLNDMTKYLQALLNNCDGLISGESFAYLTKPTLTYNYGSYYCRGVSLEQIEGYDVFSHNGSLTGVSSRILWSPEKKIGVILLCNQTNVPVDTIANEAFRVFACNLKVKDPEPISQSKADELEDSEYVLGEYKSGENEYWNFIKSDGKLSVCNRAGTLFPLQVIEGGKVLKTDTGFNIRYFIPMVLENGKRAMRTHGRVFPKISDL